MGCFLQTVPSSPSPNGKAKSFRVHSVQIPRYSAFRLYPFPTSIPLPTCDGDFVDLRGDLGPDLECTRLRDIAEADQRVIEAQVGQFLELRQRLIGRQRAVA